MTPASDTPQRQVANDGAKSREVWLWKLRPMLSTAVALPASPHVFTDVVGGIQRARVHRVPAFDPLHSEDEEDKLGTLTHGWGRRASCWSCKGKPIVDSDDEPVVVPVVDPGHTDVQEA